MTEFPRWRTRLDGREDDLSLLAEIYSHGRCRIFRDDHGYLVAGDFFGECEDARTVLELSENQLELMVGAALVEADGSGLEVRCGIVEEILSDGSVLSHHLFSPLVIEISGNVRLWTSAPGLASECIDAVQGNDHLEMAIRLWADRSRTWPRLYRVVEDVLMGLGYNKEVHRKLKVYPGNFLLGKGVIASVDDYRRFAYSACEPSVAGRDARHAKEMSSPPPEARESPNPKMSHDEAVAFVRKTLYRTLEKLRSS